ncbi:hypothetical protein ACTXT7_014386 [Hymenolepis weldensis]
MAKNKFIAFSKRRKQLLLKFSLYIIRVKIAEHFKKNPGDMLSQPVNDKGQSGDAAKPNIIKVKQQLEKIRPIGNTNVLYMDTKKG